MAAITRHYVIPKAGEATFKKEKRNSCRAVENSNIRQTSRGNVSRSVERIRRCNRVSIGIYGAYVRVSRDIVKNLSRSASIRVKRKKKKKREKKKRKKSLSPDKSLDRIVIYNFLLRENAGPLDDIERKETRCRER